VKRMRRCSQRLRSDPMSDARLSRVRLFAAIVAEADLSGLAFQHLALCRRRAWLHTPHRLRPPRLENATRFGTARREQTPRSICCGSDWTCARSDRLAATLRLRGEGRRGREGAFYALMLWAAQGAPWTAVTDLVTARRKRPIPISAALIEAMIEAAETLVRLRDDTHAPVVAFVPLCASCSYRGLCGAG
jgi:CRISPR-associated exonuclease Cas4